MRKLIAALLIIASPVMAQYVPVQYNTNTGLFAYGGTNGVSTNTYFSEMRIGVITNSSSIYATNAFFTNASVIAIATSGYQVVNYNTLTNALMHPYISVSCTNTLTSGGTSTTNIIPYTDTDIAFRMQLSGTNQIQILQTGVYRIFPSVIASPSLPNKHVRVWIQQNGTNVPRSAMRINVQTASEEVMLAEEVFLSCLSNDLITVAWGSLDDANMQLVTTPDTMGPVSPAAIVVMEGISD